jgi:hypothetical protein
MAESGILNEGDNVQLIDGEIIKMPPIGSRHAAFVDFVSELFRSLINCSFAEDRRRSMMIMRLSSWPI